MFNSIRENIERRLGLTSREVQTKNTALIENIGEFSGRYRNWRGNENLVNYPFIVNTHAPFTPARRALPMLNLALISSAGAYIDGTTPFDTEARDGDASFREIPIEVEAEDLLYAARGYDATAVRQDRNVQIPINRLLEFEENNVIGQLNSVWWSSCGFIPNARLVAEELAPQLAERVVRYEAQAALLIPASRLCHQTLGIVARAIEKIGVPTIMLSVDRSITDRVRPPRTAFYAGEFGSVAGKPDWREFQIRILEESLRWIESFDQPTSRGLMVNLETEVQQQRGER
ncbi:MAG: glycine/betaine/sarcosine/D-proline family reductase selenoprotein B [Acidobacteria bacterium]|nr:glycine/betaine/sarcosine/D-proline family reductase selenoprotein B [Acidobacteriota bacterium]MCA1638043.1 glycine/betaine/sarcosine/D-proline family reductase selenoprotein B [Acidobacteriota bacterium]